MNPTERPPILLLGTGRCGTTVLQESLNTSEQIVLWGEHSGFLGPLLKSFDCVANCDEIHRAHYAEPVALRRGRPLVMPESEQSLHWANAFDRPRVVSSYRAFIKDFFARDLDRHDVHWGFKEIRYRRDTGLYPAWKELFPGTKWLFLVRDPFQTLSSMSTAWRPDLVQDQSPDTTFKDWIHEQARAWVDAVSSHLEWHRDPEIDSHFLRFEDLESDPARAIEEIFDFLGLPVPEHALLPFRELRGGTRGRPERDQIEARIAMAKSEITPILAPVATPLGYL